MATTKLSLRDELRSYNAACDRVLRSRYSMSFRVFKTIKAITQLVGVLAGIFAIQQGADPELAFALIAVIWAGPEAFEHYVSTQGEDDDGSE